MYADTRIIDPHSGATIAEAGEWLDDETLYRIEWAFALYDLKRLGYLLP